MFIFIALYTSLKASSCIALNIKKLNSVSVSFSQNYNFSFYYKAGFISTIKQVYYKAKFSGFEVQTSDLD